MSEATACRETLFQIIFTKHQKEKEDIFKNILNYVFYDLISLLNKTFFEKQHIEKERVKQNVTECHMERCHTLTLS